VLVGFVTGVRAQIGPFCFSEERGQRGTVSNSITGQN